MILLGDLGEMDLLQGTLDMLILKAVSLGEMHGYGILLRIQQISKERLAIQQGSLYPALYRLEHQGVLAWNLEQWKHGRMSAARRSGYGSWMMCARISDIPCACSGSHRHSAWLRLFRWRSASGPIQLSSR